MIIESLQMSINLNIKVIIKTVQLYMYLILELFLDNLIRLHMTKYINLSETLKSEGRIEIKVIEIYWIEEHS